METLADRYRLEQRIGAGGMGEVWGAWDELLGRPVAVKLLHPEVAADPAARRRFQAEARMSARLVHPNVVGVYDSGDRPRPYIVMERVPGWTLKDLFKAGPLDPLDARRLAGCLLEALAAARRAGVLHRDIKPSNILAAPGGGWKLSDFGIAKSVDPEDQDETATGLVVGTPAYLAPERLHGRPATMASDLFSVGAILYEAVTGRRPFETSDSYPWTSAAAGHRAAPVQDWRPDLDAGMAAAIDRAVHVDPAQRFADPEEMLEALSGRFDPELSEISRPVRWRRRAAVASVLAAAVGGSLALALVGGATRAPANSVDTHSPATAGHAGSPTTVIVPPTTATTAPTTPAPPPSTVPPTTAAVTAAPPPSRPAHAHHGRDH